VSRALNFEAQATIEVEPLGYDLKDARALAREVAPTVAETPEVADVFVSREEDYPRFDIVVDREKARPRPG
jgi:multidrug efflux pump subunit AcrB